MKHMILFTETNLGDDYLGYVMLAGGD